MKRKLIIVLSIIVLCAVVFTFVACDSMPVVATNDVSVIFHVDDAEYARVKVDENFALPANPTSESGAFAGWYLDSACITVFNADKVGSMNLTADLDVYARFVPASSGNANQGENQQSGDNNGQQGGSQQSGNEGQQGGNQGQQGGNEGQQGGHQGQQGGNEQDSNEQGDAQSISLTDQRNMQSAIDAYLDSWLTNNAEAEGFVTDQKKLLSESLGAQGAFSFTDESYRELKPSFNVTFEHGTYTVVASWGKGAIKQTFIKAAKTDSYASWSGKSGKPQADWLLDGDSILTVDKIVSALVKTVNTVSGNVTTGKFGISGIAGVEINGKGYGLEFKGNVDGTQGNGNEIGLAIVDTDGKAIGGLYYRAAATAADSKLYLQYASRDEDGKLIRDHEGNYTYNYKYIDYADLYGFIEKDLTKDKFGKTPGLITKTVDGRIVALEPDSLAELLGDLGESDETIFVTAILNKCSKAYENEGRYYIDINIGDLVDLANAFLSSIATLNIQSIGGLQGHITLSAAIGNDGLLTDLELAVNVPKCTFRIEMGKDMIENNLPALSFAVYLEDFSFLTSGRVANVIPAEAIRSAEYFSPTNLDFSGDLYLSDDFFGLDDTFRIDFVTEINPFEIIVNGEKSASKVALQVRKSAGSTFDVERAEDYFFLTYDNATALLTVRGTAFELGDNGQTLYTFYLDDEEAESKLKNWLGLDAVEFDRASGTYSFDRERINLSALVLFDNDLVRDIYKDICGIRDSHGSDDGVPAAAGTDVPSIMGIVDEIKEIINDLTSSGKLSIEDGVSLNLNRADIESVVKKIQDIFDIDEEDQLDLDSLMLQLNSENYRDMLAFSLTTGDGGVVTFLIDASEATGFKIGLTIRLDSLSETRAFDFRVREGVTSFTYQNVDRYGRVVRDFRATLSNVNWEWGSRNADKLAAMLPTEREIADSSELFPADGTGPVTAFLTGAMKWANTDEIKPYLEMIPTKITRMIFDWFSKEMSDDSESLDNALVA